MSVSLLVTGTTAVGSVRSAASAERPTSVRFTGAGTHEWTVPDGVTRVEVIAAGGGGGASADRLGGRAAKVIGTIDVSPGQVLYAVVGGLASGSTPGGNGGGAAGGPGCIGTPGAGGGASDVRTIAPGEPGSAESRIVVAGGGGGAGLFGADEVPEGTFLAKGGHRGQGGGTAATGGWGGGWGGGPQGGAGGGGTGPESDGTVTTGGRGQAVAGSVCGGGGGGGWGGGGGGGAQDNGAPSGGGGGGGSLVPGGYPAGMAARYETPSVTFRYPGLPVRSGPLKITSTQTFKANDQGGGIVPWTNCGSACGWYDGDGSAAAPGTNGSDFGYQTTQRWGAASLTDADFGQSGVSARSAPAGSLAEPGEPFALTYFLHINNKIRGDSPRDIGLQTLTQVQAPAGAPAVFDLRGERSLHLNYLETQNDPPCDPQYQESLTPCDDVWLFDEKVATTVANGVTWHFELLGFRRPDRSFSMQIPTEEMKNTQADIYARVSVDTNPTTSTLSADGQTFTLTTTPVPQTGGTVTFTDGGSPIEGCTDVPVDAVDGTTTCTPSGLAPGAHAIGGAFSGGVGYAASTADPIAHTVLGAQTISFEAPTGLTYGDPDVPLGATASSGLPVTYESTTPAVCTIAGASLHIVGAGSCSVTASQAGNADYSPAESQTRTFDIAKALLTVTADNKTRSQGVANPPLTATTTGFVNGDTSTVVSGTPGLSTTASAASPPGTYPISVSVAGLSAANYTFTGVDGTLTVTGGLACTRRISGWYPLPLLVVSGTTCVAPGTVIGGPVLVAQGASLELNGATVNGAVIADRANQVRVCGSTMASISVSRSTGQVTIGDPSRGCAGNKIAGFVILLNNRGGLVASGNTVGAWVIAMGNRS